MFGRIVNRVRDMFAPRSVVVKNPRVISADEHRIDPKDALSSMIPTAPKTAKNTGIWIDFCHKSGISGNLRWKKLHNSLFYACLARCLLCQAPIVF